MTLRELLDAATPWPWTWITDPREGRMLVADWDGATHLVVTEIRANEPLFALAPELAALLLDMADALDNLAIESKRYFLVCRACGAMDERPVTTLEHSESCYVGALLARLDRIGTQTSGDAE